MAVIALFKSQVSAELGSALDREIPLIERGIEGMIAAQAAVALGRPDAERLDAEAYFLKFAALVALMGFGADLRGRRRLLLEARDFGAELTGPAATRGFPKDLKVPREAAPLRRAIDEILKSEPKIAIRASAIAKQYVEMGMSAARSARIETVKAVQRGIRRMVKRGERDITVDSVRHEMGAWAQQYANTVADTNVATAYNAGRFSQAGDPEVKRVASAFELIVVDDAVTRRGRPVVDRNENHLAAQGLTAAFNDPIWLHASAPNGYNCRETVRLVSNQELEARGLLSDEGRVVRWLPATFGSFAPHPRFTGMRPDQRIYGSTEF